MPNALLSLSKIWALLTAFTQCSSTIHLSIEVNYLRSVSFIENANILVETMLNGGYTFDKYSIAL